MAHAFNGNDVVNNLIFTSLSKNSATLYTYDVNQISSKYPNLNLQELIDDNLEYINGSSESGNMFGTISSFKRGSMNNLVMLYAKDMTDEGDMVTVVTIVDENANRTMVFHILNDILIAFAEENSAIGNGGANSQSSNGDYNNNNNNNNQPSYNKGQGNTSFKLKMKEIIDNPIYRDLDQYGSLTAANQEIDQVRNLMNDNIERVLQRGERIHLLVNKTDKLNNASNSFRRRTVAIKRRLWWNNVKFIAIATLCGLIVLYLIGGEFCGLPIYNKCFKHNE